MKDNAYHNSVWATTTRPTTSLKATRISVSLCDSDPSLRRLAVRGADRARTTSPAVLLLLASVVAAALVAGTAAADAPPQRGKQKLKPVLILKGPDKWIDSIAYSPDGKTLFTNGDQGVRSWDLKTGKVIRVVVRYTDRPYDIAFSLDRKRIAVPTNNDQEVRVMDTATGKVVRHLKGDLERNQVFLRVALSPNGGAVAAISSNPITVHVWEVASGKKLYQVRAQDRLLRPPFSSSAILLRPVFSPDGRILAIAGDHPAVSLCDVKTGKEIRPVRHSATPPFYPRLRALAFSPDSRLLATAVDVTDPSIYLWEATTGKLLTRLGMVYSEETDRLAASVRRGQISSRRLSEMARRLHKRLSILELAFSPDGRWLATEGQDKYIRLWEVATGKEGPSWRVPDESLLAFSPDGKTLTSSGNLVTEGFPSSVAVWDRACICRGGRNVEKQLRAEEVESCWADLASPDAGRACRAIWVFVAAPLPLLKKAEEYVRASPRAAPTHIRRLVSDLDARRLRVREKAAHELAALGDRARSALEATLADQPSLEVRRRMERLLAKINAPLNPERLRHARLIEVLEHMGTSQARELLRKIAGDRLGPSAATDATATLRRMARRDLHK